MAVLFGRQLPQLIALLLGTSQNSSQLHLMRQTAVAIAIALASIAMSCSMFMKVMKDYATGLIMGATSARLLRKQCLVTAVRGDNVTWWERLPVHTLTFANPDSAPLGVRIDAGDVVKVIVPGVKPKSYSMSRQGEGEFDITFKTYPNGACSGYLDSLQIGDEIQCFAKGKKSRNAGTHLGLVAFGVGITEALPVAEAELAKEDAMDVKLIWASKTWADTFWHNQINALKTQYGDRFELVHVLSREERAGCRHGRVDPKMLEVEFAWDADRDGFRFMSVGTKVMMKEFDRMIHGLGFEYPKHQFLVK